MIHFRRLEVQYKCFNFVGFTKQALVSFTNKLATHFLADAADLHREDRHLLLVGDGI